MKRRFLRNYICEGRVLGGNTRSLEEELERRTWGFGSEMRLEEKRLVKVLLVRLGS